MFKKARLQSGMSAEEAAFRLNVGIRTLYRYERGETIPPADVICLMARTYKKPELIYRYCREYCPIGAQYGFLAQKETAHDGVA